MCSERPTCDMRGCDAQGYARYQHEDGHWIDVCSEHRPGGRNELARYHYHTISNAAYPAEKPSRVMRGVPPDD